MMENTEKLLTIIVPIYNMEKYLRQCADSFLVEREYLEKMEILLIDDASSDHSVEIAKEYEEKYPGIFRSIQKENGGHGSVINRGILEASGRYTKVVDSDDWLITDTLCKLLETLENTQSDIVYSNYYWVDDKTGKTSVEFKEPFPGVVYGREYRIDELMESYFLKMHGYTVKTSVLKQIPAIDENCFYVDMEFVLFPVPYTQTITFIEEFVYMYRIGRSGQSVSSEKLTRNAKNFDRVLKRLLKAYSGWKEEGLSQAKTLYTARALARMYVSRMKIYLCFPFDREIQRKMKKLSAFFRQRYPEIYSEVRNRPVQFLHQTGFLAYPIAKGVFEFKERVDRIR